MVENRAKIENRWEMSKQGKMINQNENRAQEQSWHDVE